MIITGIMLDELYEAVDAIDGDDRKSVIRALNLAYQEEANDCSWMEMRRTMTGSNGTILPSPLLGIDAIYDASGNIYQPREKRNIGVAGDEEVRRWFISSISTSALVHQKGATIVQGTDTINFDPAIGADYTGEYIIFENDIGMYRLATSTTIDRKFMGETQQQKWFKIRPEGTKTLGLRDSNNAVDTTTVTIDYWEQPTPIYHETDIILLPTTEALFLRTLRRYYKITRKDMPRANTFNDEYREAKEEALARNPVYAAPTAPRNRLGLRAGWGSVRT